MDKDKGAFGNSTLFFLHNTFFFKTLKVYFTMDCKTPSPIGKQTILNIPAKQISRTFVCAPLTSQFSLLYSTKNLIDFEAFFIEMLMKWPGIKFLP